MQYIETAHGYIMTTKRTARMRGIQRYKNQPPSARLMAKKRLAKSSLTEFSV